MEQLHHWAPVSVIGHGWRHTVVHRVGSSARGRCEEYVLLHVHETMMNRVFHEARNGFFTPNGIFSSFQTSRRSNCPEEPSPRGRS